MEILKVKVKFYSNIRDTLPSLNYGYRPHFVVKGDGEYLGIQFLELDLTENDTFGEAVVKLLYDNVGYYKLKEGVIFDIIEGSTIVGEGYVLKQ